MKKSLSFMCSIIILLSLFSFAFAETDQEILFRGVPWGENLSEVRKMLKDDLDLGFVINDLTWGRRIVNQAKGIATGHVYYDNQCQYLSWRLYTDSAGIDVAGYPLARVFLYYACIENESGILTRELDDTAFYMGKYGIHVRDDDNAVEIYNDLKNKLSSLYGEPDLEETDKSGLNQIKSVRWNGKNDTMAILALSQGSSDSIDLSYAWGQGDKLMEYANKVYEKQLEEEKKNQPTVTVDPENTNGL